MIGEWILEYYPDWDKYFVTFDIVVQKRLFKKIQQLKNQIHSRQLKKIKFKIEEVGQYRIAYFEDILKKSRKIYFVGNHKQYEKWYKSFL